MRVAMLLPVIALTVALVRARRLSPARSGRCGRGIAVGLTIGVKTQIKELATVGIKPAVPSP